MKGRTRILTALAAAGIVAIWYVAFYAPQGREREAVRSELEDAQLAEADLHTTQARLEHVTGELAALRGNVDRLRQLIPAEPDVGGFIRTASQVAGKAGVHWVSLSPSPAVADARTGQSTIQVTIEVEGTFFQLLSYLKELEALPRLVVIDSVDITGAARPGLTSGLSVALSARLFTTAPAPAAAPGTAAAAPVPSGATTAEP